MSAQEVVDMASSPRVSSETRLVKLSDLHPAPWNPRTIREPAFKKLCAALKVDPDFLWDRPVLAREENREIYAGNMRFRAAEYLAKNDKTWPFGDEIPARLDSIDEQLAQERALRDNNQFGDWAEDDLSQLIARLETQGADIMLLGFDDAYVKKLLQAAANPVNPDSPPEAEDDSKIDALIQKYGTKPGQLWLCESQNPGIQHKIFCGDSADPAQLDILFAHNERATLLLTDPPYNVGYDYTQDTQNATKNDKRPQDDYNAWSIKWFTAWQNYTERQIFTPPGIIASLGFFLTNPNIFHVYHIGAWIKTNSISPCFVAYFWCHEPILFCGPESGWGKKEPTSGKSGTKLKKRGNDLFEFPISNQTMPTSRTQNKSRNAQPGAMKKEGLTDYHPCPKPYELWKELIDWYSQPGDVIADAFLGSGTLLVAAEQLSRSSRTMEISPGYVALALERWAQYTKREPQLLSAP